MLTNSGSICTVVLTLISVAALAQGVGDVSPKDVAIAAGKASLSISNAVTHAREGNALALIPIDFDNIRNVSDLNNKVIGGLITNQPENVSGVAPGRYIIYSKSEGGKLRILLISEDTDTAIEVKDVTVSQPDKPTDVDKKANVTPGTGATLLYLCLYDKWLCWVS